MLVDRGSQAVEGLLVELGDADVADVVAFAARAHRTDLDRVARQRELDRILDVLAR